MKWEERMAKQKALAEEYKKKGKSPYMAQPSREWEPIKREPPKPKTPPLF